uniref:N-acetyltransferase domain-containing protein n=1 Tax=Parastrongyloides trichosuri TaxID=131310 RepID=A0A0N4ZCR0_PARTI
MLLVNEVVEHKLDQHQKHNQENIRYPHDEESKTLSITRYYEHLNGTLAQNIKNNEAEVLSGYFKFLNLVISNLYQIPEQSVGNNEILQKIAKQIILLLRFYRTDIENRKEIINYDDCALDLRTRVMYHKIRFSEIAGSLISPKFSFIPKYYALSNENLNGTETSFQNKIVACCSICNNYDLNIFNVHFNVSMIPNFIRYSESLNTTQHVYGLLLGKQKEIGTVELCRILSFRDNQKLFDSTNLKNVVNNIAARGYFIYGIICFNQSSINNLKMPEIKYREYVNCGVFVINYFNSIGTTLIYHFPRVDEEIWKPIIPDQVLTDYVVTHFTACTHIDINYSVENIIVEYDRYTIDI